MVECFFGFPHPNRVKKLTVKKTKCASCFITKYDKSLLKNVIGFLSQKARVLLQNATVITKFSWFYYKMLQLLQSKMFITRCVGKFIVSVLMYLFHMHFNLVKIRFWSYSIAIKRLILKCGNLPRYECETIG